MAVVMAMVVVVASGVVAVAGEAALPSLTSRSEGMGNR